MTARRQVPRDVPLLIFEIQGQALGEVWLDSTGFVSLIAESSHFSNRYSAPGGSRACPQLAPSARNQPPTTWRDEFTLDTLGKIL